MAGIDAIAMMCNDKKCCFKPARIKRRALGDNDVHIEMKYCGVCHSDLHFAADQLGGISMYPMVPGHELAGVCVAVGKKVTKFSVGDQVGVGCFVDSCLDCRFCKRGEEQYCDKQATFTYSFPNIHGRAPNGPGFEQLGTMGGYSTQMVCHERFAIKIPKDYPLEKAGPVMCAGITVYDPMVYHKAGPGTRLGIMGLGGLGMMAIKIGKALGCEVTVISRSDAKREYALGLGADKYVASSDPKQMGAAAKSLDLILNTISASHELMQYQPLLDTNGTMVLIGLPDAPFTVPAAPLIFGRQAVAGSIIGGIKATQEVIDLCAAKKIYPETKVVPVSELNGVFEKLAASNDAGVRYVLDIANTLTESAFEACAKVPPPDLSKGKPRCSVAGTVAKFSQTYPIVAGVGAACAVLGLAAAAKGLRG